jgi:maltose alpha-D-glucosyltransferase/alpha-amylase
VNVENQRRDPSSLLNWMTALIRLRKECPEIGIGNWQIIKSGLKQVLIMCYSWEGHSLLVLHNFAEKPLEVVLTEKQTGEKRLIDLMKNIESLADEKGKHTIILEAYGYRWFRAGNLEHLFANNV